MTGMLASITSVAEAKIVLDASVDIIDIKNPHEGALGAQKINVVKDIVGFVNQEVLTSATIGDIDSNDSELLKHIITMADSGVDYVKVGLFSEKTSDYFINTINEAANKGIKLVIVLFAENYYGTESIQSLMQTNISGIMLDTKEKKSKNLCSLLNKNELYEFVGTAKANDLITGLAGSLTHENIAELLELKPDYLGFRGALCSQSNRINNVNEKQVDKIRKAIPYALNKVFEEKQYKEAII
jgi:uncharacterized protein (UPF0264 family)